MRISSIISVVCLAALVACSPKDPKNPKFVVASFKDGKVTRADLTTKENEFVARFGGKVSDLKPEQASMLDWQVANQLIMEKILANQATQVKDKIQPQVDAELATIKKQFAGNAQDFQKKLSESGLTENDLRDQITQQEAVRYLIKQEKDAPAPTTEADAQAFYDQNKQFWNQEELYSVRYIVVAVDPNATDADKKQKQAAAESARKRVAGGEDFEKVAKEVSANDPRAGAVQQIPVSGFSAEIAKVIKSLKPGGISSVQDMGRNLLIFQVVSVSPAKVLPFSEVKDAIMKRLQSQKEEAIARRVIEKLRDNAKIQFNIPDPTKAMADKPATSSAPAKQ
jgi:parvulin-like peptidyl-prolyl isomerase